MKYLLVLVFLLLLSQATPCNLFYGMNPLFLSQVCLAAAIAMDYCRYDEESELTFESGQRGKTRIRERRTVEAVRESIGDYYFRRSYRMSYDAFIELHAVLQEDMKALITERRHSLKLRRQEKDRLRRVQVEREQVRNGLPPKRVRERGRGSWERYVPNGHITTSVRLAVALRFFAGGSLYDIAPLYGISRTDAFDSVWIVVAALNKSTDQRLSVTYPESHDEQKAIARAFQAKSTANFSCCAGAVDGILIWIHQPTTKMCKVANCDPIKFFCGRKHKHGLNCQAVVDCRGRFLDVSVMFPASTSDCLAFEGSSLFGKLERGLLADGLCIFGDNAYVNSPFLCTPYPNVSGGEKDAYNFFHSQLRIRVECAFGMLVQRWGILRGAIPRGISIGKTTSLVVSLTRLQNFCIEMDDRMALLPSDEDELHIQSAESGSVEIEDTTEGPIPTQLLGGGEHFDDIPRETRRLAATRYRRGGEPLLLPRERLLGIIQENGFRRPPLPGPNQRLSNRRVAA